MRQAIEDGCTHIYTRSLDAALFASIADVPTILEQHMAVPPDEFYKLEFLARSPTLDKLVVISKPLIDEFKGCRIGLERKTVVLHDGADISAEIIPPFSLDRSPGARVHIGYVGHLYPGKGAEISLELARRMPHADFHMLGGTPEDVELWKRKAAGIANIKFYGHRPHKEVPSFIAEVDLVIAPFLHKVMAQGGHRNIAEFFSPLKIFEYMAQGKAIVASDLPVLREVLHHRENALLCDPNAIETFIEAIEELCTDRALRARLGAAARQRFEAEYTWSARADRILAMISPAPNLECGTAKHSPARRANGESTKPRVRWHFGGEKQAGWAYGINARRLSSRIPSCDHIAADSQTAVAEYVDVAIAFDILILSKRKFQKSRAGKRILRVGGPNPLKELSGGKREILTAALAKADAIIALSPQLRDELRELHPAVYFIPNGIDLAAFHPSRRKRSPGKVFTVGLSASMGNEHQRYTKGYYFATEACKIAGVGLFVVGRGINQIPHDRLLEEFYAKIDVLVHPVGAGKEASSNVIMESLALGIPVVTTRYAGFHGVALRDGVEALITRRTAGDFAQALVRLRDDLELRDVVSRGGRAFVKRHHSLDQIAQKYEAVIWSCLNGTARDSRSTLSKTGLEA